MTTAIYMRVSTDRQDCESQRHELEKWAAANAADGTEWFEETVSGAAKRRPEFDRMMALVDSGEVVKIVCYAKDRLGRDMADRLMTIGRIHGSGCDLVSITEGTSGKSMEDILIESIRAYVAASERRSIGQRTKAGIAASQARGNKWGGSKVDPSVVRGRRKLDDAQETELYEMVRDGSAIAHAAKFWGIPRTTASAIYHRRKVVDNASLAS